MILTPTVRRLALLAFVSAVGLVPSAGHAQQPPSAPAKVAAPEIDPPADAVKTKSGLATKVLVAGTGTEHPTDKDLVRFTFVGYRKDGTSFKSPAKYQAQVASIALPGLLEGLKMMVPGETRRLWLPEKLAFRGAAGKPAGPMVFDVQMDGIVQPPAAPADVAAPPPTAEKTKSGLAFVVTKPGDGNVHPTGKSTVTVHYTGWTTDGKLFDSSLLRGTPTTFPLDRVIPGWTEGLQLMVPGESRRFWIPEKLAYQGAPDKPKGMLVFDVELVGIDMK